MSGPFLCVLRSKRSRLKRRVHIKNLVAELIFTREIRRSSSRGRPRNGLESFSLLQLDRSQPHVSLAQVQRAAEPSIGSRSTTSCDSCKRLADAQYVSCIFYRIFVLTVR